MANSSIRLLNLPSGRLSLRVAEAGEGRSYLLLHGGAGPRSMQALFDALAATGKAILPTHPGFEGEDRPDWLSSVQQLAECYVALLEEMNLGDVTIVGNSVGGWIAAEMGLLRSPRVGRIVLINAVGIDADVSGNPIVDPMAVSSERRAALAFHDPERFAIAPKDPAGLAAMADNQRTLYTYAGEPFMHDPTLRSRLADLSLPTLILWGESDGIVDVEYGRRYAAAICGSRFKIIAQAGHFPQIERLGDVQRHIAAFGSLCA
ncbi:alpha/beta fold hydrolase [Pleomorphomonas oryzae]|uniref:alpha/beta fold hydrolase n=1 Tax=Pleomorphomonas oryzae TaxID=261934 RepID=UPI00047D8C44|nr:alpha/beta fold hydrolase [Pleomorphomonas oryzae]